MFKKIIFTVSFILISLCGMAQKDINNFKYVLVPKSFEFSNSEDQYQLNSLLKFLFNKYGYEAYFANDDLPEELKNNRCLALNSEAIKAKSGLFKTKLEITLKDCFGNTIKTSQIGESREKDYQKAYTEALREAFETFQDLDYSYVGAQDTTVESSTAQVDDKKKDGDVVIAKKKADKIIDEAKDVDNETIAVLSKPDTTELHYAQPIKNGFQLVNSEPRIVMVLLNTAAKNVFIVQGKSAIVFKEDGYWYYSENTGELEEKKSMNIKF
ncbi:hypothetical protein [Winogradskyella schleiferi]|uniref:hypothetical protein n=1 Tax=Winogradskyella schleiferi TaxID=2686078 RepID=UPI0015BB8558|nr:hypothetical protein [Winogradskyella schleiferi]